MAWWRRSSVARAWFGADLTWLAFSRRYEDGRPFFRSPSVMRRRPAAIFCSSMSWPATTAAEAPPRMSDAVGECGCLLRPAGCYPAGRSAARWLVRVRAWGRSARWASMRARLIAAPVKLVLEAGLRQAPVAGSAQAMGEDALGDGAFDAGADLVAGLPLVGLLQRPGLVECVVVVPGPQRDLPALGFGTEIPGLPRLVMRFP